MRPMLQRFAELDTVFGLLDQALDCGPNQTMNQTYSLRYVPVRPA